jgi:hypothetical protein
VFVLSVRVLSGRGLCDELITRPEQSYRLWCVVVCYLETSRIRRPLPALGRSATGKIAFIVALEKMQVFLQWIHDFFCGVGVGSGKWGC